MYQHEAQITEFLKKIGDKQYVEAVEYLASFGVDILPEFVNLTADYMQKDIADPMPGAVVYYGMQVVQKIGRPCLPVLFHYLKHSFEPYCQAATCYLGSLGYIEALPYLRALLLMERSKQVRLEVKGAIKSILAANNPTNFQK